MKKKIKVWDCMAVLLLLSLATGCKSDENKGKTGSSGSRPVPKVDGYVVSPSVLVDQISVSGSLLPFEEVELKNEVAGRIVKINLPEGKFVKEGTLLVQIYDDDLQANLKKLQAQLDMQEQIFNRQTELFKVNGISQNDYDQTALQISSIKAEIEVQKAQIRKTEILAPFDGVIGLRNVSLGAMVTTSTLLATLRMEDQLKLDFSVPEKYGSKIISGLKVNFTLQGDTSVYSATVMATEREIETSTRNMKVRATVDQHSNALIPGAYANVQLSLGENSRALMVPTQSIIPQERGKSIIVAQKGKAHLVEVKTGVRTANAIEITDGVQPGDTVVTSGILFLKEGMKLTFSSVQTGKL
jgi:membrane fusion protein, multidrug efflux system